MWSAYRARQLCFRKETLALIVGRHHVTTAVSRESGHPRNNQCFTTAEDGLKEHIQKYDVVGMRTHGVHEPTVTLSRPIVAIPEGTDHNSPRDDDHEPPAFDKYVASTMEFIAVHFRDVLCANAGAAGYCAKTQRSRKFHKIASFCNCVGWTLAVILSYEG